MDWQSRVFGIGPLLDESLWVGVCYRGGDGYPNGIPVRHELGALCPVRRRYLWQPPGYRRHLCFLPGVRVSRTITVRLEQNRSTDASVRHLHGVTGRALQRHLDSCGQFVDANPCRLPSGASDEGNCGWSAMLNRHRSGQRGLLGEGNCPSERLPGAASRSPTDVTGDKAMKIQILANSDAVAKEAARVIAAEARTAVAARGRFI